MSVSHVNRGRHESRPLPEEDKPAAYACIYSTRPGQAGLTTLSLNNYYENTLKPLTNQISTTCLVLVAAGVLLSGTAYAYVDPYTGGMITSSLSTILAAGLGFLSAGLVLFRGFLGRLLGNKFARYLIFAALACLAASGIYVFVHS